MVRGRRRGTYGIGIGEVAGVREPAAQVVVGAPSRDVVDHQGPGRPPVVRPRYGAEPGRGERWPTNAASYRSWPAVSQICNLIFWPLTSMIRVPNSTPIVWGQSAITGNGVISGAGHAKTDISSL